MKQSAPMAQETSGFELTTVGFLAHALGKMTGGMIVDKELDLGNTDVTLLLVQAIYQDAGDKRLVCGSSPSLSGGCIIVFDDGSIDKFSLRTDGAAVVSESHKASDEEIKDSEAYLSANVALQQIAVGDLQRKGLFEGDDYTARTVVDASGAVANKVQGRVITVIRKAGIPAAGYITEVEGVSDGMSMGEAMDLAKTRKMTDAEIDEERKLFMDTLGTQNIFNTPVGQA